MSNITFGGSLGNTLTSIGLSFMTRVNEVLYIFAPMYNSSNGAVHILYSEDEGVTWQYSNGGYIGVTFDARVICATNGEIYVGKNNYLYKLNSTSKLFEQVVRLTSSTSGIEPMSPAHVRDVKYFNGAYFVFFTTPDNALNVTSTYDFITFFNTQVLGSVSNTTVFAFKINEERLTVLLASGAKTTYDGVTWVYSSWAGTSCFQACVFKNAIYAWIRVSNYDYRLYKIDGAIATEIWTPGGNGVYGNAFYVLQNKLVTIVKPGFAPGGIAWFFEITESGLTVTNSRPNSWGAYDFTFGASSGLIEINGVDTTVLLNGPASVSNQISLSVNDGISWQHISAYDTPEIALDLLSYPRNAMSVMAGKAAIIPYSISNTVFSFVEKEKSTIIFLPIGFTGNNARYGQWIVISSTTMIYIYAPDSATIMRAWITYNAGQTWTPYLKMLEYLESKDYSDSPSTAQNMYKSEIIGQFQTADTEDYAYSVYELDAAYLCVLRYAKKTDTWSHSIVLNDGGGAYYISVIAHDNYVSFVTTNVYVNPNQLRIYTSTDYGASFTLKLSNAGFVNPLAASRSGTRLLFLTINQGVGFFSPDNGATWQQTQAKLKPSVFPKYLAATDEYFIGAFQEDNTSKYMYSYDGMQWFYNPANFSLADIVGYYAYGRLEVTNLVAIDNTIMAMASDVYYSIGDTLPNGVSNQYPFLIELDGFWKDFQNCGEL